MNRRDFAKRVLAGGAFLGASRSLNEAAGLGSSTHTGTHEGYTWQRTIFCQVGDPALLACVDQLVMRMEIEIRHGEPFSPDIFAVPYFAVILDRRTLEQSQWIEYLEFRKEVGETSPCFLVDDLGWDKGWPIDDAMRIRNPRDEIHVWDMLERIQEAHGEAQKWRPDLEQNGAE